MLGKTSRFVGVLLALCFRNAFADESDWLLVGDWILTGTATCANSGPAGFDPVTFAPVFGGVNVGSANLRGVRTFQGDGTGKLVSTVRLVNHFRGASVLDLNADFSYQVSADGTITITDGPITAKTTKGFGPGSEAVDYNTPPFTGKIGFSKTIGLTTADIQIEHVIQSNGFEQQRVCHREQTLRKLERPD